VRRRHGHRITAVVALAATVAALLTACVGNPPGDADWLAKQPGIAKAIVKFDATSGFTRYGSIHGELKPGLSDAAVTKLAEAVQRRQADQRSTSVYYLGMHRMDFGVGDAARTRDIVATWRDVSAIPGILNGLVKPLKEKLLVTVSALRSDQFAVLDALQPLHVQREVGGFASVDEAQNGISLPHIVMVEQPPDCVPDPADLAFARSVPARTDVIGARLDLCRELRLVGPSNAPMAPLAAVLRDDIIAAGVTLRTFLLANQWSGDGYLWSIALAPGVPAAFPGVTAVQKKTPQLQFTLDADGLLTLYDFDHHTDVADMVARVTAAPASADVPEFHLVGEDGGVRGHVDALPALLAEVQALNALPAVKQASLTPTTATVQVEDVSSGSTDPMMRDAADQLKASGIATRYQLEIDFSVESVVIRDGVAVLGRVANTGSGASNWMQPFVDEWNGVPRTDSPSPTPSATP
jgi:hypothetical protein